MKYYFSLLLILFFTNLSISQSNTSEAHTDQIKILPPSLENYNFTKYGNLQLNGNNGSFNYSVPVYNINYGPLDLSISLDYTTSGVKVNDIAGLVGMGWNLNAGGMITRVIKGEPDENIILNANEELRITRAEMLHTLSGTYSNAEYLNVHRDRLIKIWNNHWSDATINVDTEQDWFQFNFNNISGSFFIDNGELYIDSNISDIKGEMIQTVQNGSIILEFKLTLPNGVIYTFGGGHNYSESTDIDTNCQKSYNQDYPTTWYLRNINYDSWNINFLYNESLKRYPYSYFQDYTLQKTTTNLSTYDASSRTCNSIFESIDAKYLSRIEFGSSKIDFSYTNQRPDYYSGKIIDLISVKNESSEIRKIDLNYINAISSDYSSVLQNDEVKYRVFLENVTVNNYKEYKFEYNNINGLPSRLSYKQDLYGYANSNNYPALVNIDDPYFYNSYSNLFNSKFNNLNGADRSVDNIKSLYGVLTKITYPTKGNTEITYENNITFNTKTVTSSTKESLYVEESNCQPNSQPSLKVLEFQGNGTKMYITAKATIDYCDDSHHQDKHYLTVIDKTTNTVLFSGGLDPDIDFIGDETVDIENGYNLFSPIQTENNHLYEITYEVNSLVNNIYGFMSVEYNLEDSYVFTEKNYSGARVKSLKDKSAQNINFINNKTFLYRSKDSINMQSTSLKHRFFFNPWTTRTEVIECEYGSCNFSPFTPNTFTVSSENQFETLNSRFNRINYDAISVLKDNGLIERRYHINDNSSHGTDILLNSISNGTPSNISKWKEGQLDEINVYRKNPDNTYKILTKRKNFYSVIDEVMFSNYNITSGLNPVRPTSNYPNNTIYNNLENIGCTTLFCQISGKVGIHYYENFVYNSKLTKQINTQYLEDGNELISFMEYEFNSQYHHQVTKTMSNTSQDNESIITIIDYPEDMTIGEPFMSDLISMNRIAEPIIRKTLKQIDSNTEELITTQKTEYFNSPDGNLIRPKKVKMSKGINNTLETRIEYTKYDSSGNILEVKKESGTLSCYIWGYNKTQPIAKIENANYPEVESFVSNLQNLSNSDNDRTLHYTGNEGALRQALDNLRNEPSLSKAMISTYTYDPLIGVTSMTDPRGYTIYYEYDEFNRLKYIKDKDGNILSKNEYQYSNQN